MISASTAVAHDTIQSDIELAVEAAIEKLIPSAPSSRTWAERPQPSPVGRFVDLVKERSQVLKAASLSTHHMDNVGQVTVPSAHIHDVNNP